MSRPPIAKGYRDIPKRHRVAAQMRGAATKKKNAATPCTLGGPMAIADDCPDRVSDVASLRAWAERVLAMLVRRPR